MFEIDKKNFKSSGKTAKILIIIGFILFIIFAGIEFYFKSTKNSMDKQVKAHGYTGNEHYDDEGNLMYSPIFNYTVNGKEYTCKARTSSSSEPSSNTIIYYNSSDPSKCITSYDFTGSWLLILGAGLGLLVFGIGIFIFVKNKKVLKKAKYLTTNGKLIKGLPYSLEGTNTYINGNQVQKIVVYYEAPNGLSIKLVGNDRYDLQTEDADGLVDLLIDPNDYSNYYIDFDIKYNEGAPVEYYQKQETVENIQPQMPQQVEQQPVQNNAIQEQVEQQPIQNNTIPQQVEQAPVQSNIVPQPSPEVANSNSLDDLNFYQNTPIENNNNNNT